MPWCTPTWSGYSRLIGLDDIGTLDRLRTLRSGLIDPAIEEHGGKIVQTGGDSLLVTFDSIDGAVRCAVKVQQRIPIYNVDGKIAAGDACVFTPRYLSGAATNFSAQLSQQK